MVKMLARQGVLHFERCEKHNYILHHFNLGPRNPAVGDPTCSEN
jgi:hypothetical protein